MDEFLEKYNGCETLCLDMFNVRFGGNNRFCCDFLFSNDSLKKEFTIAMAQKFGGVLTKNWLFYQKDENGQPYMPTKGDSCFDLEKGDIVGLQRMQDSSNMTIALKMVLEVAREMGIEVVERKCVNLSEHVDYGDKLKYEYRQLVAPGNVSSKKK